MVHKTYVWHAVRLQVLARWLPHRYHGSWFNSYFIIGSIDHASDVTLCVKGVWLSIAKGVVTCSEVLFSSLDLFWKTTSIGQVLAMAKICTVSEEWVTPQSPAPIVHLPSEYLYTCKQTTLDIVSFDMLLLWGIFTSNGNKGVCSFVSLNCAGVLHCQLRNTIYKAVGLYWIKNITFNCTDLI